MSRPGLFVSFIGFPNTGSVAVGDGAFHHHVGQRDLALCVVFANNKCCLTLEPITVQIGELNYLYLFEPDFISSGSLVKRVLGLLIWILFCWY